MSGNPFDNHLEGNATAHNTATGVSSIRKTRAYSGDISAERSTIKSHDNAHHKTSNTATSTMTTTTTAASSPSLSGHNHPSLSPSSTTEETIWMARNIEWPLASTLPPPLFNKLNRASKSQGLTLGIQNTVIIEGGSSANSKASLNPKVRLSGGGVGGNSYSSDHRGVGGSVGDVSNKLSGNGDGGVGAVGSQHTNSNNNSGGGYYTALGGLMGKFMGGHTLNASADAQTSEEEANMHRPRSLRPPRLHCVASSNGWIITSIECIPLTTSNSNTSTQTGSSTGITPTLSTMTTTTNTTIRMMNPISPPPLRLVSRWNVRRGNSSAANSENNLIPLPPPVLTGDVNSSVSGVGVGISNYQIAHVFVDPTGCHTLISSMNGEVYYLHSTSKKVCKLAGFGPYADGSSSNSQGGGREQQQHPGFSAFEVSSMEDDGRDQQAIQLGLTSGSYLTAVGWDKKRSTEGSTKKILLGTSFGEIYEYLLISPNVDTNVDGGVGGQSLSDGGGTTGGGATTDILPLLLVKLNVTQTNSFSVGNSGVVSGLHFERLGGGGLLDINGGDGNTILDEDIIVLVATSGSNKQTRLHTYLSMNPVNTMATTAPPLTQSAFQRVFSSRGRNTFTELPGSINYADLKICGDGIAMRTETGIYYGTIDKSDGLGRSTIPWNKGGNGIIDAGILSYESINIPISIAITPHHFITLSETNEVRFINRVAKKTIQKERVDWVSMAQSSAMSNMDDGIFAGGFGELIMDIRRTDQVWLRKSRSLVHISSSCEDRDNWKFTLQLCLKRSSRCDRLSSRKFSVQLSDDDKFLDGEFEHAKSLCSNNTQRAVVTAMRAEFHLSQGRTELAAKYMAQCPSALMSFSDTAIRLSLPLLQVKDFNNNKESKKIKDVLSGGNLGLITYLSDKMRAAKERSDGVACTMIGAWLAELYLYEREHANSTNDRSTGDVLHRRPATVTSAMMQQFLLSNLYNMDAKTILSILSSHDVSASECAEYAAASGDIGVAVNAALCTAEMTNGALDALRVLSDSPIEQAEPFYYRYAFALLSRAPMAAVKSFLGRYSDGLNATKLLPAFMRYERQRAERRRTISRMEASKEGKESSGIESIQIEGSRTDELNAVEISIEDDNLKSFLSFVDDENASIKYLEGAITLGCQNTAVYYYLVSLYVDMEDEAPLFRFLSTHVSPSGKKHKQQSPLDMSAALRVILKSGRHYRSAVKLYMGFGMRQRAVELAIKVDPDLARELARESMALDEKKRLWLMIARDAASEESSGGKDVVAKVLSVLKDCGPDVLSIEDVLPFLPDVAQIDQFKDEICNALTSYSSKIDQYLKEMNECDKVCQSLRDEVRSLGNYNTLMKGNTRCAFTHTIVMNENESFYVFPSGYAVLESALKREVMPYLNEKQRSRVETIEQEIHHVKTSAGQSDSFETSNRLEELQSELDGLIAAECPLTGTIMVDSIDREFAESKEDELYCTADVLIET